MMPPTPHKPTLPHNVQLRQRIQIASMADVAHVLRLETNCGDKLAGLSCPLL